MSTKPIVFDLFCGLGGWSESFIAEGYHAIGFDIEAHDYGKGGYPGQLVLRDIRSLNGADLVREFGVPACIVASPPCQEFSYMAMPWSRAKQIQNALLGKCEFPTGYKGSKTIAELTDFFHQCFRIQREVSAAAGHYVPMVVENVRGAQRWVGKARWNFGSFYLWGDVPALMPIPFKTRMKSQISCAPRLFSERIAVTPEEAHALHYKLPTEGHKSSGMNWSDLSKRGQDFTRVVGKQAVEGQKGIPHRTDGHWTNPAEHEGAKGFKDFHDSPIAALGSKSSARKEASAMIAKIPPTLAAWIAKCFKPKY